MAKSPKIKPGDMIEWVYEHDGWRVADNEELWSRIEERWVPIGRELVHLCINYDDKTISWLNEKGLFRARVDDTVLLPSSRSSPVVVPHVCK